MNAQSHLPLRVLSVPIALSLSLLGISGAIAQEHPGCFAQTESGRVINLDEICNFPEMETPLPGTAALPGETGVFQAQILRRQAGIPVIQVVFNGRQPFEMMVDTGASGTVITPIMAEVLGVIPTGRGLADTPSQRGVEFEVGLVDSIEVGGATANNIAVAIAPALDVGLLGQDFFGEYDVTIKEDVVEFRTRG
ncbi:retropepsin-like aspartic protease [Lyngbya sp. CCY1209]|uniref:retropepsin-like aspartic protease family protein n=1 Tax=Lyngbya sp. CCY1209 TaxID=2886103 RepID=UPI002D1FF3C7|nr:retropepsin-like aspartic protease [Lyngbya sp. CCY1209]MEB3883187.1 retroviral-like aspartic protease family protein [Lyngbya sp. CCY1209]